MKIHEILSTLEELAPLAYTEDFDNTGLLIGNKNSQVKGILVTLDALESVLEEAIKNNCNLIISFHPIVFSGLKKITGKNYVERVVAKAIKNDVAIYAIHTALDNSFNGVNAMICEKLALKNRKVLIPQKGTIKKLVTFAPLAEASKVKEALFNAGAGEIGNYSNCSFTSSGEGTFNGNEGSNPKIGAPGITEVVEEQKIEVTFQKHLQHRILKTLFNTHSYEEVAYEITTLENTNQHIGMGMVGELDNALTETEFLVYVKSRMETACIRHSKLTNKKIKKVAVLGGSGNFAIDAAKATGADAFVTSDLKYHDFFKAENNILLTDIGHYESEQFTKELLYAFLNKKISNFAPALAANRILISKINTNPISYF